MTLSKNTLDNLLEAESYIRSAIKSDAVNEKPLVVKQLSEILMSMEQTKKFDEIIEMNVDKLKSRYPGGEFDVHQSENRKEGDV